MLLFYKQWHKTTTVTPYMTQIWRIIPSCKCRACWSLKSSVRLTGCCDQNRKPTRSRSIRTEKVKGQAIVLFGLRRSPGDRGWKEGRDWEREKVDNEKRESWTGRNRSWETPASNTRGWENGRQRSREKAREKGTESEWQTETERNRVTEEYSIYFCVTVINMNQQRSICTVWMQQKGIF